eukprot:TRINITY_DN569_c0_g1_i1.p1 TRINITY_DN569_c0_g1~~TRINITY_DN569_c0_g1_i1.p1  ORF type:complete len:648 (-),score=95.22 TRINITY_DN569_c0_g1_i1:3-1946(-)
MSGLTDQQYLVHRARELKIKDPHQSKAWMLTANSLFPDTFSIQFESYSNEKEANHFKECASYFQKLLKKFPSEDNFWKEINKMTDALKAEFKLITTVGKEGGDDFYLQLFDHLDEEMQQKVLILASERSDDTMQKCHLLLILIKKFPALTFKYGESLVETLVAADSNEQSMQAKPVNCYRRMLVADVLPVILGPDSVPLPSQLLHKLLTLSLEFTVALVNRNSSQSWDIKDPWNLMLTNLEMIGRGLRWPICKNISKSRPEQIIVSLSEIQRSALQSSQDSSQFLQFFYCALVTCLQAIYQYDSLISAKGEPCILVEAFVTHDSENKTKRRKTTEDTTSPLISHGDDLSTNLPLEDKLIVEFQNACGAWQLFSPSAPPQKFHSVLTSLASVCGRLDAITKFNIDYLLQAGQFRECLQEVRQYVFTSNGEQIDRAWAHIKLCIAHYCMGDYRSSAQSAVDALGYYDQLLETGKKSGGGQTCHLTKPTTRPRHVRFMSYTQQCVLGYCCKLLTSVLQESVGGGDMALGNMLVLCQCDWPSLREQVYLTLHRIKMKQGLNFPLFTQYVINMDIIEELTYLSSSRGGGLSLDVIPGARGTPRVGTRGANRGEKEDFKIAMMKQASRSHEDVNKILVEFLTKNPEYILQCLS